MGRFWGLALAIGVLGCGQGEDGRFDEGVDADATSGSSSAGGTGGMGGSGGAGEGAGGSASPECPEPSTATVEHQTTPEAHCPEGFDFDATHRLCSDGVLARGPFTPAMRERCGACGGESCEERDWPVEQARQFRGTGECPPGTSLDGGGLCQDGLDAYGPFSKLHVARCLHAGGGEVTCRTMRWEVGFAQALQPLLGAWSYPIVGDWGIRNDSYGGGHFGAPRSGNPGGHSGIDFLAPIGTPVTSPCDGEVAYTGYVSGYGNYVQIVCRVPDAFTAGAEVWASMAYAHLDSIGTSTGASVSRGQTVGTVGKTGNANVGGLNPHLHFEVAMHGSKGAALAETHASSNHANNGAGDAMAAGIESSCWGPFGFEVSSGPTRKGRRLDPFMFLTCLQADKPTLMAAPSLQASAQPWSNHYSAGWFNPDEGLE